MTAISHRTVETNGIRMHVAEAGEGPLVVLWIAKLVPNLRRTIMLPGCGHWTQQERPREVNAAMIEFLKSPGGQ